MRKFLLAFLIISFGLLSLKCSKSTSPPNPTPEPSPDNLTGAEKSLIESSNRFGLRLFRQIAAAEEPDSNIFISPLSVSFALGMTYNGAANETREAMAKTLELSGLTIEEANQSYRSVIDLLTQLDPIVAMQIANSIWYKTSFPVKPDFIELNRTYFDALVQEIDFSADWAADTINHWVDVNTNGKIKKIVESPIPPEMVMYLINAVYFKGAWTVPFDTGLTMQAPFYFRDGGSKSRDFMLTDTTFDYHENDMFQAIDLPYGKKGFSMTILLPKTTTTADDLISEMTDENLADWLGSFTECNVELWLPKFKFKYKKKLNEVLQALGMEIAFDPYGADFGNMAFMDSLIGNIYISEVMHKTFVQVDEEGTEAAAVTSVGMGITSVNPDPVMIINRPFVFVIGEHESGTILFMGKVADPVWEK
jgi:serine protease inhibitor